MTETWRGVFALMNRALLTEDRMVRTHLYRGLFVLLSYIMLLAAQRGNMFFGAPGMRMFNMMCFMNFFCITLAAVSFFAAAITEEKEEMTLGLLKMAGVKSLALLIGKSMPRLISAMVLVTAQLPFTMLSITLGGVSLRQVLAAYFCLIAYLFFASNLALFFSVVSQRSRSASVLTGGSLAFFFFGPFFFGLLRGRLIYRGLWAEDTLLDKMMTHGLKFIASTSAYDRLYGILGTTFSEPIVSWQVTSNLSLGLGFFILAWLLFEPSTRNEKPPSEARGLLFKRIGARGALGAGRAWNSALAWKDFNFVSGGKIMWIVKALAYVSLLVFIIYMTNSIGQPMTLENFGQVAMMTGLWSFIIELGVHASRVFYTEVKWKTLSSVVLLPKSIGQLAYEKLAGCLISSLPAVILFIIGVICAPESFGDALSELVDESGFWYLTSQIILFLHLTALLSVYLKWGAFPVTFFLVYFGNMLMIFLVQFTVPGGMSDDFLILPMLVSFIACGYMHYRIGRRLRELAAT